MLKNSICWYKLVFYQYSPTESNHHEEETRQTTLHEQLNDEIDSGSKDHVYDTIDNKVTDSTLLEWADIADVNSEIDDTSNNLACAAIENGQGIDESNPKSENITPPSCMQNTAYAVLGKQKDKTEYKNIITPWSYYMSSEVDTSQNMAYGAFDTGQRVTIGHDGSVLEKKKEYKDVMTITSC